MAWNGPPNSLGRSGSRRTPTTRAPPTRACAAVSVNERLQRLYQPYTAFLVVPIFALANAGVRLTAATLRRGPTSPLTWGIVLGLVLGKFVGITGARHCSPAPAPRQPRARAHDAPQSPAARAVGHRLHDLAVHRGPRDRAPVLAGRRSGGRPGGVGDRARAGLGDLPVGDRARPPEEPSVAPARPVDPTAITSAAGRTRRYDRRVRRLRVPVLQQGHRQHPDVRAHFGDDLRYVFRHLPLDHFHPHARSAAAGLRGRRKQGRFLGRTTLLRSTRTPSTHRRPLWLRPELGLDMDRFARRPALALVVAGRRRRARRRDHGPALDAHVLHRRPPFRTVPSATLIAALEAGRVTRRRRARRARRRRHARPARHGDASSEAAGRQVQAATAAADAVWHPLRRAVSPTASSSRRSPRNASVSPASPSCFYVRARAARARPAGRGLRRSLGRERQQ